MINVLKERSDSIPIASIRWASSWPALAEELDRRLLFSYMESRFGIPPANFSDYLLLRKSRSWFLLRDTEFMPSVSQLKVSKAGLRAFHRVGEFVKPTTRFVQSFGRFATRSKVHIDRTQLQALWKGEKIPVDIPLDNGYVILIIGKNNILGLGLYVNGRISSQLPRKEIRNAMLQDVGLSIEKWLKTT